MGSGGAENGPPVRPKVLIVEDEWLIAIDIATTVEGCGYEVLGPAHTVATALEILESSRVDCAMLDVNLRGETSYPVADALAGRGIPFAFLSGYASSHLRSCYQAHPLLSKPVDHDALCVELERMLRSS